MFFGLWDNHDNRKAMGPTDGAFPIIIYVRAL